MLQESPVIPHNLGQLLWLLLASSLGWVGGWLVRRKREPIEIAKVQAETRQINVSTDLSLIEAATMALAKAERLQNERDHWELKAFDLQVELKDVSKENGQLTVQAHLDAHQIKRLKAILDYHEISYSEADRLP
jgi:hypothetical protein